MVIRVYISTPKDLEIIPTITITVFLFSEAKHDAEIHSVRYIKIQNYISLRRMTELMRQNGKSVDARINTLFVYTTCWLRFQWIFSDIPEFVCMTRWDGMASKCVVRFAMKLWQIWICHVDSIRSVFRMLYQKVLNMLNLKLEKACAKLWHSVKLKWTVYDLWFLLTRQYNYGVQ